jgi:hypothetical protein
VRLHGVSPLKCGITKACQCDACETFLSPATFAQKEIELATEENKAEIDLGKARAAVNQADVAFLHLLMVVAARGH